MIAMPEPEPVPIKMHKGGILRVGDTRVTLDTVVNAFNRGMTPEEIVLAYSVLALADVYNVLAYYLYHRVAIDEYIRQREERAAVVRAEVEARHPEMVGIRECLLKRRTNSAYEVENA